MWIKTYIMTIITVVLLSSITEALMPETDMKKHLSLVVGLVVLFAMAKPLISIPRFAVEDMIFRIEEDVSSSSKKINEKIEEAQINIVNNQFSRSLSETISKSVYSSCGIKCNVDVSINNGTIEKVFIDDYENDVIKNFIKNNYGLECTFQKE